MLVDRTGLPRPPELHGAGQAQVRNLWANVGAFHPALWVHTPVELWVWDQPPSRVRAQRRAEPLGRRRAAAVARRPLYRLAPSVHARAN